MDICFSINNGYVDYCRVAMVSVLENNKSPIHFHILTDTLLPKNILKLQETAETYGAVVSVYDIDDNRLKNQKTTWSKYGWYRIFAHEVIPANIHKVLYLDCDTIVEDDISELFNVDLTGKSLAAVTDLMEVYFYDDNHLGYPKEKGYFCSGVLLMNLDFFREHDLANKILEFAEKNPDRINFPDQDALNYICQDTKITLPLKYGILAQFFTDEKFINSFKKQVFEALEHPKIIHYANCAPWIIESNPHYFDHLFWKYAKFLPKIRPIHCCQGSALLKLYIKKALGILKIKKYSGYVKSKKPSYNEVMKKLMS